MPREAWNVSVAVSAGAAIVLAMIAGLEPAYSKLSPQRVNLVYFENGKGPAHFLADTSWKGVGLEPIPAGLMKAGPFKADPNAWQGLQTNSAYVASAGDPRFPLPTARVLYDRNHGGARHVEIAIDGSSDANGMVVSIPKDAKLTAVDLRGQHYAPQDKASAVRIICWTPDCRDLKLSLVLGDTGKVAISFAEVRYGLPEFGKRLQAARPDTAMASQSGDETILANAVELPTR